MSPLKIGVIGVGRMGRLYARIAAELPQAQLVAICGQREAPVAELATAWQVSGYVGGRYRQMLAEHPEIEAVVVATPEWLHLDPALAVIEAGKHLLLEKPMATSLPEARTILAAAETAGITLMVCHSLRFDPRYVLAKEALDRGDIGEILHIYARRNTTSAAAARVREHIPLTCWISPHDLDQLLWMIGSPVVAVSARSRDNATEPVDYFLATMRFASGVTAVFEQSWGTPRLDARPRQALFDIRGTAGTIEVTPQEQGLGIFTANSAVYPAAIDVPVLHGRAFGIAPALVTHFVDCVAEGRMPLIGGRDGVATVAVAEAISRSLREGREVAVDA